MSVVANDLAVVEGSVPSTAFSGADVVVVVVDLSASQAPSAAVALEVDVLAVVVLLGTGAETTIDNTVVPTKFDFGFFFRFLQIVQFFKHCTFLAMCRSGDQNIFGVWFESGAFLQILM